MTDPVAPVVIDIEATIKAEVAKAVAAAKAEESAVVVKIKAFVAAHYSKVIAAAVGWATAQFHLIEMAIKLI